MMAVAQLEATHSLFNNKLDADCWEGRVEEVRGSWMAASRGEEPRSCMHKWARASRPVASRAGACQLKQ